MLLLSEKESFGLVLLEAMACGVPCIGTRVGGIPEVIQHGETGYLCEVGDTTGVANQAIQLLRTRNFTVIWENEQEKVFMSNFAQKNCFTI